MSIPKRVVKQVLERDGHVCQIALDGCTYTATVADHRANRGHGGSTVLDNPVNLIAACTLCNGRKETVTGEVLQVLIRRGVRVLRASTNALTLERAGGTPVIYRTGDRYILRPDGGRTIMRSI